MDQDRKVDSPTLVLKRRWGTINVGQENGVVVSFVPHNLYENYLKFLNLEMLWLLVVEGLGFTWLKPSLHLFAFLFLTSTPLAFGSHNSLPYFALYVHHITSNIFFYFLFSNLFYVYVDPSKLHLILYYSNLIL